MRAGEECQGSSRSAGGAAIQQVKDADTSAGPAVQAAWRGRHLVRPVGHQLQAIFRGPAAHGARAGSDHGHHHRLGSRACDGAPGTTAGGAVPCGGSRGVQGSAEERFWVPQIRPTAWSGGSHRSASVPLPGRAVFQSATRPRPARNPALHAPWMTPPPLPLVVRYLAGRPHSLASQSIITCPTQRHSGAGEHGRRGRGEVTEHAYVGGIAL